MAVTLCSIQLGPAVAFEFLFELEGVTDFLEFDLNNLVILVTVGVAVSQDCVGLLNPSVGDEPPWRLWNEPEEAQLKDGGESLSDSRCSP